LQYQLLIARISDQSAIKYQTAKAKAGTGLSQAPMKNVVQLRLIIDENNNSTSIRDSYIC